MVKKNTTKDTERSISFFGKAAAVLKNETVHFVAGLILVIFSVYLLLAFSSFFFTGAADQSIIDSGNAQELISTHNGVKNYRINPTNLKSTSVVSRLVGGYKIASASLPFSSWCFWL